MKTRKTQQSKNDTAAVMQGVTIFGSLDDHSRVILAKYVKSRRINPLDALNGAVEMAFSNGGLTDTEAVEEARQRRLADCGAGNAEPAHFITINLSPVARAMLLILMDYEGHATEEAAVLSYLVSSIKSLFNQVLGGDKDTTVAKAFGLLVADEEEGEAA